MSKKVRLLTEELPTLDFLTHTKPEVYNNQWLCPFCNNKEDFNHIWTCSYHIERMQGIVASSKTILRSRLFLIVENLKEDNIELNNILDHGSWWEVIYKPKVITFIDLIKGIIPYELSRDINLITHNQSATKEILTQFYDAIYSSTQDIWRDRCSKVIEKEHVLNIDKRTKCKSSNEINSYRRSAYIDQQIYKGTSKIIVKGRDLIDKMVTLGCHFSNF